MVKALLYAEGIRNMNIGAESRGFERVLSKALCSKLGERKPVNIRVFGEKKGFEYFEYFE